MVRSSGPWAKTSISQATTKKDRARYLGRDEVGVALVGNGPGMDDLPSTRGIRVNPPVDGEVPYLKNFIGWSTGYLTVSWSSSLTSPRPTMLLGISATV
jgi:hypothetical protein